jgi:hypothetical protein
MKMLVIDGSNTSKIAIPARSIVCVFEVSEGSQIVMAQGDPLTLDMSFNQLIRLLEDL